MENGVNISTKYAAKSHTHTVNDPNPNYSVANRDTRGSNYTPAQYMSDSYYTRSLVNEFKSSGTIGTNFTNYYCNLLTIVPWTNASGGRPTQIATDATGMAFRSSASDTE